MKHLLRASSALALLAFAKSEAKKSTAKEKAAQPAQPKSATN